MKEYTSAAVLIATGVVVGGLVLFGLWSLHQDHKLLQATAGQTAQIVNFINAAQKSQPAK